jgi:hypothetical protein
MLTYLPFTELHKCSIVFQEGNLGEAGFFIEVGYKDKIRMDLGEGKLGFFQEIHDNI